MPTWQFLMIGIASAGLLLNVVVAVIGATWGIAKIRQTVTDLIEAHRAEVEEKLTAHREAFDEKLSVLANHTGEVGSALRQKIHDVELFGRDNYVKRDSFAMVVSEIKNSISEVGKEIGKRLTRMETKLMRGAAGPSEE